MLAVEALPHMNDGPSSEALVNNLIYFEQGQTALQKLVVVFAPMPIPIGLDAALSSLRPQYELASRGICMLVL